MNFLLITSTVDEKFASSSFMFIVLLCYDDGNTSSIEAVSSGALDFAGTCQAVTQMSSTHEVCCLRSRISFDFVSCNYRQRVCRDVAAYIGARRRWEGCL